MNATTTAATSRALYARAGIVSAATVIDPAGEVALA